MEDDGAGMDGGQLAAVRARLEDGDEARRGGRSIGLANVHQRLKLYCGPAYGLRIASAPGEGTRVTLRIPRAQGAETGVDRGAIPVTRERNEDVSLAYRR